MIHSARWILSAALFAPLAIAQSTSNKSDGHTSAPDYNKGVDRNSLDTAGSSLKNLDLIRDRNLNMVQKDGCPPDVSARLADLKWKLQMAVEEQAPAGGSGQEKSVAGAAVKTKASAYTAVASEWFKPTGSEPVPGPSASTDSLDSVLPASTPVAAAKTKGDPREVARLEAEIKTLESGCAVRK